MTSAIELLHFEEGFRARPYLDTEGYPTVGYGFKLGPKWEYPEKGFRLTFGFELPKYAAQVWLECLLEDLAVKMVGNPVIAPAWKACDEAHPHLGCYWNPRLAVLMSMAYQMGVEGLAKFKLTLGQISLGNFEGASVLMLESKWASQTPERAKRHAEQMRIGQWAEVYRK